MSRVLSRPQRPSALANPRAARAALGLSAVPGRVRELELRPKPKGDGELLDLRRSFADRLVARARRGQRLLEAEKRRLTVLDRLRVQRAEREVLHAMTAKQRHQAYRERRLSSYQLSIWWGAYPREIPRIDGHPEWIAATLVDVCEHPEFRARLRRDS